MKATTGRWPARPKLVTLAVILAFGLAAAPPVAAPLPALATATAAAPSPVAPATAAIAALPPLPEDWPSQNLELGLTDYPGGAASLHASGDFAFRYQYLAGGVNTGSGWATWNSGAKFADYYVDESIAVGMTPVFPYYQMLQSKPGVDAYYAGTMDEDEADLYNLNNAATMQAYWADVRLLFQHLGAYSETIVIDVEPDLWGYIQQAASGDNAATIPAAVASSGDGDVAGLPNNAAGFAQAFVRLRDMYAPNVLLGYHMSAWGTMTDPIWQNTPLSEIDALADRAAAFEASLGAAFDLSFGDPADRDADFDRIINGDGGQSWWDAADYARWDRWIGRFVRDSGLRMVMWQIPLGNTKMRAMNNSWGHYQDNHVEWWLGDGAEANLQATVDAGVIALLYGGGADGTTSASDAMGDGTTNPPAINGNTQTSYSADDDGGYFRHQAGLYYSAGAVTLPGAAYTTSATAGAAMILRGTSQTITTHITAAEDATVLLDVELIGPTGTLVTSWTHDSVALTAGVERTFVDSWPAGLSASTGTYTVRIGVEPAGGGDPLAWNPDAATFTVRAGGTYVPLDPFRLLDTRHGTGGLSGKFASGKPRTFGVTGSGGVPVGAIAVTGNLTITGQTSAGYLALGPVVPAAPTFSTMNFPSGDNRANGVTVALSTLGQLQATFIGSSGAQTHVIFDITGYFAPDFGQAGYHPLSPYRAMDTRHGTGGLSGKFVAAVPRTFPVGAAVPSSAVAVTGNLTVTGQSEKGYVALAPTLSGTPSFSTLNFPAGDNRANNVTVKLGPDGTLAAVYMPSSGSSRATTNLIFDVTGYYQPGSAGAVYVAIDPLRMVDTRRGLGLSGPLRHSVVATFSLASALPAGTVAVSGNATVTRQTTRGYVVLAPALTWPPTVSTLNFPVRDNRANGLVVPVTPDGKLKVAYAGQTSSSTTHFIFDLTGYFIPDPTA